MLSSTAELHRVVEAQRWGEEILQKSAQVETAFDSFSEKIVDYARQRIRQVTKGISLSDSKRFKIWSDFHQVRLDPSSPMRSAWKELLESLSIPVADVDTLLEQSVYSEMYTMLNTSAQALHLLSLDFLFQLWS